MPTPLFPFTWQYNNQPIEVLAADVAGLVVNTENYIPVSNGTTLVDSFLEVRPPGGPMSATNIGTFSMYNGQEVGLGIDFKQNYYNLGGTNLTDSQYRAEVVANADLAIAAVGAWHPVSPGGMILGVDASLQAITSTGTATTSPPGAASGKYLKIYIDGVGYKMELLDYVP